MTTVPAQVDLSIVVPVYNEESNLEALYQRLTQTLDALAKNYEIIFVNDGSQDRSPAILHEFYLRRPDNIRVIHFNANFGQHMAIIAAFERVRGHIIITLDADLQNPPEEINKLIQAIERGHDYVGGVRKNRFDNAFRRYASKLNNLIRHRITKIQMTDQGCMLRAYSRRIIDLIIAHGETSIYIPALAYSFAMDPIEVEVAHEQRLSGKSKYNLYSLLRLNFDIMTGFSLVPLQTFTLAGMVVSLFSALLVIYLLVRRAFIGPEADGIFTLFAILYLLVGIGLMGLGIVGEYVGRIYKEVRRRPRFIIHHIEEQMHD